MRALVLLIVLLVGCAEGVAPSTQQSEDVDPNKPKTDMGTEADAEVDLPPQACRPGDPGCECLEGAMEACPGNSMGICDPGMRTCIGGSWGVCEGIVVPQPNEVCNGLDDDCDGEVDEGFGQVTCGLGICEVAQDACQNGRPHTCVPGMPNPTGETCDGVDDDCDGQVDEGCECQPNMTQPCYTGPLATRGQGACKDGVQTCSSTGQWGECAGQVLPSPDICDGVDNDCSVATADGSQDPGVGVACDGPDADLCEDGVTVCSSGTISCSEVGPGYVETCSGMDDDCDGEIDEDVNVNDNPVCNAQNWYDLGQVRGDVGSDTLTDSYYDEEWIRVRIHEASSSDIYLSATFTLVSAPGTDFDLYVYCYNCGGALAGSSTTTGTDVVRVRGQDATIFTDSFYVLVEVRHKSSTVCGDWQLTVVGNTAVSAITCF